MTQLLLIAAFALYLTGESGILYAQDFTHCYVHPDTPVNALFRIYEDDDFINIRGKGTDDAYTNGTRLNYFYMPRKRPDWFVDNAIPRAGDSSVDVDGGRKYIPIFRLEMTLPSDEKIHMRFARILLTFLAAVSAPAFARAQANWELKKDQDGIKVYSRAADNSHFDELKVEMTLTATLSSLAALILDIDNYHNWSFNTEKAYVLKRVGPADLYFYTLIHSPWPASDRDLPVHLEISQDAGTKSMSVRSTCISDLIPPKKDVVRVPLSIEQWTVNPLPDGRIRIEYYLKLDPGAGAPAWLINLFSVKGPFETFSHLRQQIRQPPYRDALLPFIKN